jgi:hypothetical protein
MKVPTTSVGNTSTGTAATLCYHRQHTSIPLFDRPEVLPLLEPKHRHLQIFVTARPTSDAEALPLLELKLEPPLRSKPTYPGLASTLTTHNCSRNPKNSRFKPQIMSSTVSEPLLWSSHAPTSSSPSRYPHHPEFMLLLINCFISLWNRRCARPTYPHHDRRWRWILGWWSRWGG